MATTRASVKRSKTDKKYLNLSPPKKISNTLNNSYIILNQDEDILETNMQELTQIVSDLRDKLACSEHESFSLKEINESLNSKIEKLERELNAIKTETEKQSIITNNFTNLCSSDLHSASTQTETAVQGTTYIQLGVEMSLFGIHV
ncbi:hypothetical protein QE152_g4789 [Popillia japonica]|uniref:Uncharacterized protein n=1 Tax=Popillia japonica TaxID=7064 RepID=A0AAW1MRT4_POPJA